MSHNQQPMSIEAMLDMERKEVLALLENRPRPQPAMQGAMRSASPYATPRSPVRSMLDVGGNQPAPSSPRQAPVRSMLDTTSPPPPRVRSMLDTETPLSAAKPSGTSTTPNSPVMTKASLAPATAGHTRSFSDAASNPVEFGPRAAAAASRNDPTAGYQFSDIITRNSGQQLPKRNTQGGKKPSGNALSEALRNSDLSGLQIPGESDRKRSWFGGNSSRKSKSPHNRLGSRSRSPHITQTLNPGTAMLDDGTIVDLSSAYRRLSDANLAYSTGSLSTLPMRKRENSDSGRMVKDYLGPDGEVLGSSEDDEPYSSDDEDRGRKKAPRSLNPDVVGQSSDDKERRKSLSLLAAAEEERVNVSSKQPKYRSLLDEPEIKVTTPLGENTRINKGSGVHPKTAYDQMSTVASANDSDEEADMDDIKRAQNLICSMSNIISTPESHRAIRMIYRGDYNKIAQQAEEEQHRLRKYLVASDLSDESTHALEWAIGTVLRDGDTLMCIYCVDEETSIGGADNSVPDDPKAMKEQAAAINTVASSRSAAPSMSAVPDFVRNSIRGDSSKNNTPNTSPAGSSRVGGERGRAEDERRHAVKQITDKVLRLLRKTTLQVRVIVEVLHCKNPKHLITEVIDLVNPTLVVIGSRGRSALKGVILGSFSNYLVTKSSVPVMVARKRLRKQGKYRGVKPVNNLSNPTARSLANAKID